MKKLAYVAGILLLTTAFLFAQNPVADKNAQKPQSHNNKGQAVTGKTQSGHNGKEVPVTTTGSTGQNTPGAETEAGVEQQPGGNSDVPHTAPAQGTKYPQKGKTKTALPPNDNDPGQSPHEADANAQAAARAEITPGSTLGVGGTTNSNASPGTAAQAGASGLPQTDQTSQSATTKKTAPKKTVAQPKSGDTTQPK